MVEGFPHRAAHQNIPNQAVRAISEGFRHVKNKPSGAIRGKVGAIGWWLGNGLKGNNGFYILTTDTVTEILTALPLGIIAIGDKAITKRTKRSSFVVVTTQNPIEGVFVGLVTTQVNDAASVQVMIDDGQDEVGTEGGIASDGVHI